MPLIDPWAAKETTADGRAHKNDPDTGVAQAQWASTGTTQPSKKAWQCERFKTLGPGEEIQVCTSLLSGVLNSHFSWPQLLRGQIGGLKRLCRLV